MNSSISDRKKYAILDDIGLGTQEKKSPRALAKMYKETAEFIRKHRELMKQQSPSGGKRKK